MVSIGGGFGEDISLPIVDNSLITPSGHQGVTFVAPTGDLGTPGWYPAYSSNVVAVGLPHFGWLATRDAQDPSVAIRNED